MRNKSGLAFDKSSVRSFDKDGRMHVAVTNISKANVCPYMGNEIPGWDSMGLDPGKIYRMYRDPDALSSGASSFNNLPLLRKHIQVTADAPMKDEVVGSIGSDVKFTAPYLSASLCIWDAEAIALVESGALDELSSAYHYTPIMESGTTPDGEAFDGRMTAITGNHLALVEVGRAGSDVMVADSDPFFKKVLVPMKKTKLGRALVAALSAVSPKIAQDSLSGLVGGAVAKGFDSKKTIAAVCAMDEDLDEGNVKDIVESVVDLDNTPEPTEPTKPAEDENDNGAPSKHAEVIDFLKSKGLDAADLEAVGNMLTRMDRPFGKDENMIDEKDVDAKVDEGVKTAMDSMRKSFVELESAKAAVRTTVGDVLGMDSAEGVYRFALDHLKVSHKDMPAAGLATLFSVASAKPASPARASIAQDSALAVEQFPGLSRFNS